MEPYGALRSEMGPSGALWSLTEPHGALHSKVEAKWINNGGGINTKPYWQYASSGTVLVK